MKSTSSGRGLRTLRASASAPRSATRRRRISASISFFSSSMRARYSSSSSLSSSARQLARPPSFRSTGPPGGSSPVPITPSPRTRRLPRAPRPRAGRAPRRGRDSAKRPVEVVRAPDRPPGLHRRIAGHREARDRRQHGQVPVAERLVKHRRDLFGLSGSAPPAPVGASLRPSPVAAPRRRLPRAASADRVELRARAGRSRSRRRSRRRASDWRTSPAWRRART